MTLGQLKRQLEKDVQHIKDAWARGAFTHTSTEGTIQLNSNALGQVEACENILEFIEDSGYEDGE